MFYFTYLRRELRQRKRQTVPIALGFALGVGLVITVTGVSAGVNAAQAKVVHALYGVGTDQTVTEHNPPFSASPRFLASARRVWTSLPASRVRQASATRRWGQSPLPRSPGWRSSTTCRGRPEGSPSSTSRALPRFL